jgi:hypothetical protein
MTLRTIAARREDGGRCEASPASSARNGPLRARSRHWRGRTSPRLHVRLLLVGQARGLSSLRILRERREGDVMGADDPRCRPQFFARHTLTELLSWKDHDLEQAGRSHSPAALQSRKRPLRAMPVGRGVRCDRGRTQGARSQVGSFLRVWPRQPRDVVSLCADAATTICPTARTCATRRLRWR